MSLTSMYCSRDVPVSSPVFTQLHCVVATAGAETQLWMKRRGWVSMFFQGELHAAVGTYVQQEGPFRCPHPPWVPQHHNRGPGRCSWAPGRSSFPPSRRSWTPRSRVNRSSTRTTRTAALQRTPTLASCLGYIRNESRPGAAVIWERNSAAA